MSECSFSFAIRELIAVVIEEGDYEIVYEHRCGSTKLDFFSDTVMLGRWAVEDSALGLGSVFFEMCLGYVVLGMRDSEMWVRQKYFLRQKSV
jgi:hypothetical protein